MTATCAELVRTRRNVGIMGRGTESTVAGPLRPCQHPALPGDDLCSTHAKARDHRRTVLAARKAAR